MSLSVLDPSTLPTVTPAAEPRVHVVRGCDAILQMKDVLCELSRRCGQVGAMEHLKFFFARPKFNSKIPCLVLFCTRGGDRLPSTAEEIEAAVLLYEHQIRGVGLRVLSADYHGGERTVIAPAALRPRFAYLAAAELMKRGALLVQISYEDTVLPVDTAGVGSPCKRMVHWAARERPMGGYIPLKETVEATLAGFGKNTRHNLKRYRQRALADLHYKVVDHPEMTRDEFLALNRICMYPAPDELAGWRYDAMKTIPEGVLYLGLQAANGNWISLIGGRTHEGDTHIEWQMNRLDMPSYWLGTVMRSHLIDYEVARGVRRIYFVGGTPHSIRNSMVRDKFIDLIVVRYRAPEFLTRRLLGGVTHESNFLLHMLGDQSLRWYRW
jgi:hypothetical protein